MKISISKNEFYAAIQTAGHAISQNSPLPSLRGIKIEAVNDQLQITGSNADISIYITMKKDEKNNLTILEEGAILIDARYLNDIVRKLDSDVINIEVIDGALTKFTGVSATFKINGMRPDDYPSIDFSQPANVIEMSAADLTQTIDQTAFAASVKETRPIFTGVNVTLRDKCLTFTSTDTFRMAKKRMEMVSDCSFNVTIPAKSLNEVKSTVLLNENGNIKIALNDKKAQFVSENVLFQTRLLDGKYPDTENIVPKAFNRFLVMNRMDLIRAIDRTTFIKNDNVSVDRLQCSADEVVLTNKNQEIGESYEQLAADYTGEPLDISFTAVYVMDAAKAIPDMQVKISFVEEMKQFILTSPENDDVLQLVMPVKTFN